MTMPVIPPETLTDERIVDIGRYWSNARFANGSSRFLIDFARAIERELLDLLKSSQLSSRSSQVSSYPTLPTGVGLVHPLPAWQSDPKDWCGEPAFNSQQMHQYAREAVLMDRKSRIESDER